MPSPGHDLRLRDAETLADETFEAYEEDRVPTKPKGAHPTLELAMKANAAALGVLTDALQLWIARTLNLPVSTEITGFIKKDGPLTKRISLSADDKLESDGSACVMSAGFAWRQTFNSLTGFGSFIDCLDSTRAIALGALRDDLSEPVQVVTKRRLKKPKLNSRYDRIARTGEYIEYRAGHLALALIDIDTKDMPRGVRDRIRQHGGLRRADVRHSGAPERGARPSPVNQCLHPAS